MQDLMGNQKLIIFIFYVALLTSLDNPNTQDEKYNNIYMIIYHPWIKVRGFRDFLFGIIYVSIDERAM